VPSSESYETKECKPNTLVYIARYDTHHMLYLDEIPSDHIRMRQMFVCVLYMELKLL
jgi:hypothetical protein